MYGDLTSAEQISVSNDVKSEHIFTNQNAGNVQVEVAVLKKSLMLLETERERERLQLSEEIANLRINLEKAQQTTLLLTDQREGKSEQASVQEKKLEDLEQTLAELKKQNIRVLRELKSEKSKSLWQRLFG